MLSKLSQRERVCMSKLIIYSFNPSKYIGLSTASYLPSTTHLYYLLRVQSLKMAGTFWTQEQIEMSIMEDDDPTLECSDQEMMDYLDDEETGLPDYMDSMAFSGILRESTGLQGSGNLRELTGPQGPGSLRSSLGNLGDSHVNLRESYETSNSQRVREAGEYRLMTLMSAFSM